MTRDLRLHAAVAAAARRIGLKAVREVMAAYGVARMGDIPPERRPAFVAALQELGT
jgi:hypothetical protein